MVAEEAAVGAGSGAFRGPALSDLGAGWYRGGKE